MNCAFVMQRQGDEFLAICSRCGAAVVVQSMNPPVALCRPPGLGDYVANALSAVGITKERVSKLAGGDCGCSKRQEALNELGRKLGIG